MKILEQNNRLDIISEFKIIDELPVGVYTLNWGSFGNSFLTKHPGFKKDSFFIDFRKDQRDVFLKSFKANEGNLGVLLTGEKGCGKSMDARKICEELNLPVIVIDKSIPRAVDFISFLNKIETEYILMIDEFEKLFAKKYDSDDKIHSQEVFLSFIDGMATSFKKFFLLTTNADVNEFFMNRPSRIKYVVNYTFLNKQQVSKIVSETLLNPDFHKDLVDNLEISAITIDILLSIVKEINLLNLPYTTIKSFFNYKVRHKKFKIYNLSPKGVKTDTKLTYTGYDVPDYYYYEKNSYHPNYSDPSFDENEERIEGAEVKFYHDGDEKLTLVFVEQEFYLKDYVL